MNEDREREEQRHPHHQDVRSRGAPDRAPVVFISQDVNTALVEKVLILL